MIFYSSHAQEICAFDKNQARLENANPAIKQARLEAEAKLMAMDIQKFLREKGNGYNAGKAETIYEIPVVVHLMNDGATPLRTDAEIITWIVTNFMTQLSEEIGTLLLRVVLLFPSNWFWQKDLHLVPQPQESTK